MSATAPTRRLVPAAQVPERIEGDDPRPEPDQLRAMEGDILQLLDVAAERDRFEFPVKRGGKVVFTFTVQSLTQPEYFDCRNLALKKERAKGYGNVGLPVDVDRAKLDSLLIAKATIPEDRERIWMNKGAWAKFNVATADGLVGKVLRAGEIEEVVAKIDELSGFNEGTVELVGNS